VIELRSRGPSLPITDEWRQTALQRLEALGMSQSELARRICTSEGVPLFRLKEASGSLQGAISLILAGHRKKSELVGPIEHVLGMATDSDTPTPDQAELVDEVVMAIADLRMKCDALGVEIKEYEQVVRTCGVRIAEDREKQAVMEMKIEKLKKERDGRVSLPSATAEPTITPARISPVVPPNS